jgi:FtsP/CotA-like multicopper oxidase with cupredoxin domain
VNDPFPGTAGDTGAGGDSESMMQFSRRDFLRLVPGTALMTAAAARGQQGHLAATAGISQNPDPDPAFVADVEIELAAAETRVQLLAGAPTRLWQYRGRVVAGEPRCFGSLPGGQLPVIRVRQGQRVRVTFTNELPEQTIVHWHGLHIEQRMDGHPMYAIAPGQRYVYEFEVTNRAGTYWFHPHPHERTGIQVYRGLSGLFIVEDEEEARADLPAGDSELLWVLQDRRFDDDNQLVYARNHMQMMMGYTGDRVFVNGRPDHVEEVAAGAYRIRIFNGSNARFYKLAWSDDRPITVIGTDGGLLERAVSRPYVVLAPAERVELWADFSADEPGTGLVLQSRSFDAGSMMGMGMGGRMGHGRHMAGAGPANGAALDVLRVRVTGPGDPVRPLPERLSAIAWPRLDDAVNASSPRRIRLQMGRGRVSLNGRTFGLADVAADEVVKANSTEVWEFDNTAGPMAHPMHIHNVQFQVLERVRSPRHRSMHETMQDGFVDEGLKDVVTVMPGERVTVLVPFIGYTGLYLYHCHILEHEDLGMMRNYLIEA